MGKSAFLLYIVDIVVINMIINNNINQSLPLAFLLWDAPIFILKISILRENLKLSSQMNHHVFAFLAN
jgi:hypothetical protein